MQTFRRLSGRSNFLQFSLSMRSQTPQSKANLRFTTLVSFWKLLHWMFNISTKCIGASDIFSSLNFFIFVTNSASLEKSGRLGKFSRVSGAFSYLNFQNTFIQIYILLFHTHKRGNIRRFIHWESMRWVKGACGSIFFFTTYFRYNIFFSSKFRHNLEIFRTQLLYGK